MNGARALGRGPVLLALCVLGGLVAASCYRAEIDLNVLMDAAAGGTTAAAGSDSSGGEADGGALGEAGQAGAGGQEPSCVDDELDAVQAECQRLGHPTAEQCMFAPGGWDGCVAGACYVCTKLLRDYPYYFQWHPCCLRNPTCYSNQPYKCDARCPRPTERDQHPRCSAQNAKTNVSLPPD